ncbi:deoxyribodipyrimidine photo-lyase [Zalerion maritima]|uniref:Deoxyribodipyrimidine photo-lyase n=1 Tax=Zalerion maritima TaxID=339359 RepID=A0AAD5WUV4_9PEZI|nr:deoxyribodipyrimidine photo-lyase [Zalerion maritima]
MPPKRKQSTAANGTRSTKRARSDGSPESPTPEPSDSAVSQSPTPDTETDPIRRPHSLAQVAEEHGIVLRQYYPPEMSNQRAAAYKSGELARPFDRLKSLLAERARQQSWFQNGKSVVMWFRTDLRMQDNRALDQASRLAHHLNVPLVACYLVSPQDFEAHVTSPTRIDFIYRHLELLRDDLDKLDIPLHIVDVPGRAEVPDTVRDLASRWGARHVFANYEYEVDELRRDMKTLDTLHDSKVAFRLAHDTCVVEPGALKTGTGNQYAVYTPWFRTWGRYVSSNPSSLKLAERPKKNHSSARENHGDLFGCTIPELEVGDKWNKDYRDRIRMIWPAGEGEASSRLSKFCDQKISDYAENRNLPSEPNTSSLSPYLAVGSLSSRTCVKYAQDHNTSKKMNSGSTGIDTWISEVAWRDFYRHVMAHWPYVCMNKPFKPEYSNIQWSYDREHFRAWCEGRTGFPIVDAAMRQMNQTGWMHNRCRMIVASFLCKDLLLDWRMGEKYFMENLIDGDFASNNGGWGFSASVGVDPQPYFRIFNPLLQSERFDTDGAYIRNWVPELKNIKGKGIHDPYGRGAEVEAKRRGYPKPLVVHKNSRDRALNMYKSGLGK